MVIHDLSRDGEFERNVGADATLTCVALGELVFTSFGWNSTATFYEKKNILSILIAPIHSSHLWLPLLARFMSWKLKCYCGSSFLFYLK